MTLTDEISDHFDHHAPHYDTFWTSYIGERELRVIRPLIPPNSTVLDYGCGTGRTTLDLLRRGCQVTAFDISTEMISLAASEAARQVYSADFTTDLDELSGKTWPLVTCIGVLDYYSDPVPLLSKLRCFLAPLSRLIVTVPNAASPLGWMYAIGSRLHFPVIPRTPAFMSSAASQAGLTVTSLGFAFPATRMLGLTLVIEMAVKED